MKASDQWIANLKMLFIKSIEYMAKAISQILINILIHSFWTLGRIFNIYVTLTTKLLSS